MKFSQGDIQCEIVFIISIIIKGIMRIMATFCKKNFRYVTWEGKDQANCVEKRYFENKLQATSHT